MMKSFSKLSAKKKEVMKFMDSNAVKRNGYYRNNSYYHNDMLRFFRYCIPEGSRVLEIGCSTGNTLARLKPGSGTGIDISSKMIELARSEHPDLEFHQMDAESIELDDEYEYVVMSDSIGYFEDVQKAFLNAKKVMNADSRLIITYHSFLWQPFLNLLETLKLKMPQMLLNWLNPVDVRNLLKLEGYEVIRSGRRTLFPFYIPIISWFLNKYLAHLPVFNWFCISNYIVARPLIKEKEAESRSVSVIVPAMNEKGNIREILKRVPLMGRSTELIFVEGMSTDGTYEEIKEAVHAYSGNLSLQFTQQEGKGKGDAVRKGFGLATGDILMILDADLTVMPEDLPKFYKAIASGRGEYINGCRLVYPMEKQAMRSLNMMGNFFFAKAFSWILKQPIRDTLCGTKVISKANWERVSQGREYFGTFDPFGDFDLIFGAAKLNLSFIEVPIRYQARQYGDTNISRFQHGWLLFKMMMFSLKKIKFI